jgi:2-polyprenyl-3-methyl-5-hydroxy-6-metoxy-1,4-benzoquinol methylase
MQNKNRSDVKRTVDYKQYPDWPIEGIEPVTTCPACGADSRQLLHGRLSDRVFFCASGEWSMYCCESCASAFLDPRPTADTIGLAYQHYITHEKSPIFASLSFLEKLRVMLANGYRNYRYGTRDYPTGSFLGVLAAGLIPNGRAIIDAGMRHLPKEKRKGRLLDIGFGNGAFLMRASQAGWDAVGVDLDYKTVEAARCLGLDARLGGVESLDPSVEQFDVITLAHVIEHVHHPVAVLQACYRLLRADGFLWVETPNVASIGHRLFGENWRGLEPPRHLVLFNLKSIGNTLRTAGFTKVELQPYRPLCEFMFRSSKAIMQGVDPYSVSPQYGPAHLVKKAERLAKRDPAYREFITLKAWKM